MVNSAVTSINGGPLYRQTHSEATLLSSLNGGEGFTVSDIKITDSDGNVGAVDLNQAGNEATTLGDVINRINALSGVGVEARINDTGDGILLIDTAGRLHTKNNLMQELQKLHRVIGKQSAGAPHEILLVLDGSTGMNGLNQAREFNKAVKLTGLVITKLDGSAKGGFVLAVQERTGIPVKLLGQGEGIDDLTGFTPHVFVSSLVGA